MSKYEKFFVENMVGTDILCAVANHDNKVLSFEQHISAQNMVRYCKTELCSHLSDYTPIWRDLSNYVIDNNIL